MKNTDVDKNQVLLDYQTLRLSQLLLTCILLLLTCVCQAALDFPALTGRVVDQANILSDQQIATLTSQLDLHEQKTSNQVVVVTLSGC